MYLEIYQPHKLGYVSLDPYEWEYHGHYPEVVQLLDGKPEFYEGVAIEPENENETVDGERKLSGEKYLKRMSKELKKRNVWSTKLQSGDP